MFDWNHMPSGTRHPWETKTPGLEPPPPTLEKHELETAAASTGPGSPIYQEVERQLQQVANFLFFSMPNLTEPNLPLTSHGQLIGVRVHEMLHHLEIDQEQTPTGFHIQKKVGQPVAQVHMTWRPIPDDFVASPGVDIPDTPFDPTRSQRFTMHDGHFFFDEDKQTGIKGFGTGRTYPVLVDGKPQIRLAAVIDVIEGLGALAGHHGLLIVNGHIEPPTGLALTILVRLTNPQGHLLPTKPIPPLHPIPDPDPDDLYMIFLGESIPEHPVQLDMTPQGTLQGATGPQQMRLIEISYCAGKTVGLETHTEPGAIIGQMNARAWFDPLTGSVPYPFQTTDGVFTFHDQVGNLVGTLEADITEGRALPTPFPGAPLPVYRVGGIAPVTRGTGIFENIVGLITVDSFISLAPNLVSGVFVLHISDPGKKVKDNLTGERT